MNSVTIQDRSARSRSKIRKNRQTMPKEDEALAGPDKVADEVAHKVSLGTFVKLQRAATSVGLRSGACVVAAGVSASQFGVLDALYHLGTLSLGELARKHLRSPNNITTVVDGLERRGWVVRGRCASDRRIIHASLTPEGREVFEAI